MYKRVCAITSSPLSFKFQAAKSPESPHFAPWKWYLREKPIGTQESHFNENPLTAHLCFTFDFTK